MVGVPAADVVEAGVQGAGFKSGKTTQSPRKLSGAAPVEPKPTDKWIDESFLS